MLQVVPEPGRPLCGFCSWLSLSAFAHYCGWLSQLPGVFCGTTLRSQALPSGSRMERSKMAEIGFKQDRLHALHVPRIALKTRLTVVAATALVAICAHIAVPLGFTPVPVTMQTFAVLLLGLLFSPGAAFACLALYLAEGAAGLPVFSPHGPGGIAQLLGPTGGYLLSYPFAAALTSLLYRRGRRSFLTALTAAGLGSMVILAAGATWLGVLTHLKFSVVFAQSVAPFLPGDAVKILAATACVSILGSFGNDSRDRVL
jgi:biotin transport system substrate-specific component